MSNWNDDRLDRRDEELKEGFARLEAQIKESAEVGEKWSARLEGQIKAERQERKEGFAKVDEQFARMDERFEKVDERFIKILTSGSSRLMNA